MEEFTRTQMLIGKTALEKLAASKVAIFGVGGVGSYAAEGLARAGIGKFVLIDSDTICTSNINRQIHAVQSTVGRPKVEVMRERIMDINPDAQVTIHQLFYTEDMGDSLIRSDYDYIIDAVDTVSAKLDIISRALAGHIPVISCMGTGNKLDPSRLQIADISETSVCPLAKVMRRELRKRGITNLKVVYSKEEPITPLIADQSENIPDPANPQPAKRQIPGSISFVPSTAGLLLAGEVVKELIKDCSRN